MYPVFWVRGQKSNFAIANIRNIRVQKSRVYPENWVRYPVLKPNWVHVKCRLTRGFTQK
nr:MAG TPA: hypothetical protein [Caudoviricetes sp.]